MPTLREIVGEKKYQKVEEAFGGQHIYVGKTGNRKRNDQIKKKCRALRAAPPKGAGLNKEEAVAVLAREHGLSRRQVWRIIGGG